MKSLRNISAQKIGIIIKNVTKPFLFHDLKKQIAKTFCFSNENACFISLFSWKYFLSTTKEIL